jgi:hypothetical protein
MIGIEKDEILTLDPHLILRTKQATLERQESNQQSNARQDEKRSFLGNTRHWFHKQVVRPFSHRDYYEALEDYSQHRDGIVLIQKEVISQSKLKWLEETNTFAIRIDPKEAQEHNCFVAIPVKLSHQTKELPIDDAIRSVFPDTEKDDDVRCHQE